MDSPTAGKQSTGLFSIPPFESHQALKNPDARLGIPLTINDVFLSTGYYPHPEIHGLSHGGKTVHRTVFYSAFRVPSSIKKSRCPIGHLDFLVREMGLEPTRRNHTHLKRACLPFQHSRKCHSIICFTRPFVKAFFGFYGRLFFWKHLPPPSFSADIDRKSFFRYNDTNSGKMRLFPWCVTIKLFCIYLQGLC